MATPEQMRQLRDEIEAAKRADEAALKEKITQLSTTAIADLLQLKIHWQEEYRLHRTLDTPAQQKRRDAELWLKAIDHLLQNPSKKYSPGRTQTSPTASTATGTLFRTFSADYLDYVKNNFAQKTYENADRVMKFFVGQFGDKDLGSFTVEDLEKFKAQRKHGGVSNTTINIDLRTIKAAFAVALEWKRISENPFAKVKQLKLDQKTKRILSQDEFQKVLSAIKEKWLHDIIAFNVLTGLRLGEIMNLKWSDYDATKKEITIQTSKEYRVKGGKMRTIPIGDDAAALLGGRKTTSDWIFVGEKGKKYTNDYVSKKFKEYVRQVGLPEEIHYHRLRDTYCTWLAEKNVPVHIIKALAGHSSVRVTEKYISTNTDVMKREIAKIQLPKSQKKKRKKSK